MIHTTLGEIEDLVTAAGLDLDALSLIISEALDEDLGGRGVLPAGTGAGLDITSVATMPAARTAHGEFVVREPGTVAGLPVAAYVVASVCAPAGDFNLVLHATDGDRVARGDVLISITGNARALLTAERVALNLITMMSGVATATRAWVDALAGTAFPSEALPTVAELISIVSTAPASSNTPLPSVSRSRNHTWRSL